MHPEIIKDKPGQCDICGMDLVPVEELGYLATTDHNAPLVVPASAVLRTGKRAVVYVKIPAQEQPMFEGREIVLGPRAGDVFIVNSGLNEGDLVVTHGAFKIDSALQIQAKPSMMTPPPSREPSHHGHDHSMMSAEHTPQSIPPTDAHKETPHLEASELTANQLQTLMPLYFKLQSALATDNLEEAHAQLQQMLAASSAMPSLQQLITQMHHSDSLSALRLPYFETLSLYLMQGVNHHAGAFDTPIHQMYCPMAHPDRGASWLQTTTTIQNPYFGESMLRCGTHKAQLTGPHNE
jgi:Cu(I)/Ag(I) efflux system membrane fusion protein